MVKHNIYPPKGLIEDPSPEDLSFLDEVINIQAPGSMGIYLPDTNLPLS